MKRFIAACLLLLAPCVSAQHDDKQNQRSPHAEFFQLEKDFRHPVQLPASVLNILRADNWNRENFEACESKGNSPQIPAEWFVAAEVSLRRGKRHGLVVRADNPCLWGANVGPFWVFRSTNVGYQLVLTVSTLSLELVNEGESGYRDIRCTSVTAAELITTTYKFRDVRYEQAQTTKQPIE